MDKLSYRPISTPSISITKSDKRYASVLGQEFKQQFQQAASVMNGNLTVSKHAQLRMNQRNIDINPVIWSKIEAKVQQAQKMGVTDSIVLTKEAAFVISTKNNTIITAMGREEASSQIFTNINGTILIDE